MKLQFILGFGLSFILILNGCSDQYNYDFNSEAEVLDQPVNWFKVADSSTNFLISNYWNGSQGYFNKSNKETNFEYWPQAHGLDILIDAFERTGNQKYLDYFKQWYQGVYKKNGETFLNEFYDDMGWNALALLRAYQITGNPDYKEATIILWNDIKTGWNEDQDGGISWNKSETWYKNTPSNGPAVILAARLYQEFEDKEDLEWAFKIYHWWRKTLYDASKGFVYDGINKDGDGSIDGVKFTYNQGLMIGATLELYKITDDKAYLRNAEDVADYTLNSSDFVTSDGLLRDEGAGDGGLFKGIFIRYFTQLILSSEISDGERERYVSFLEFNARTLWLKGANKSKGLFGSSWSSSPKTDEVDLTVEESGSMLIEAMALLEEEGLLDY